MMTKEAQELKDKIEEHQNKIAKFREGYLKENIDLAGVLFGKNKEALVEHLDLLLKTALTIFTASFAALITLLGLEEKGISNYDVIFYLLIAIIIISFASIIVILKKRYSEVKIYTNQLEHTLQLWTITREKELEKIEEELDKYQSIIERLVDPSR